MSYPFVRILPAIFIFITSSAFAQKQETISLPDSLKEAEAPAKAKWYADRALNFANKDIEKARQYAEKGLDFSKRISCKECEVNALALIADIEARQKKYNDALLLSMDIVDKYAENFPHVKISVYHTLVTVFENLNSPKEVVKYQALLCTELRKKKEYKELFHNMVKLGDYYLLIKQNDSVLPCFRAAMSIADYIHDDWINTHKYNNMGLAFMQLSVLDSALYYFRLAEKAAVLDMSKSGRDSILWGCIQGNMGAVYYKQENYIQALPLLQIDYELLKNAHDTLSFLQASRFVGESLYKTKHSAQCRQLLDECISIAHSDPRYYKMLKYIYKVYSGYYFSQNNFKDALVYFQLFNQASDSLYREQKTKYEAAVETIATHNLEQINMSRRIAEQTKQNTELKLVLFVLGAILILVIISFLYVKRLRDHKEKIRIETLQKETKELENKLLKEEMEYKKRDLTDFAINLTQQQDFINDVLNKLKEVGRANAADRDNNLKQLTQQLSAYQNINDKVTVFREKTEKINADFFNRLEQSFPSLTPGEKELCGFIRLQLSNKEIAIIKSISPDSAKVERYRLRKKLNLGSEEDISLFLTLL